MPAQGDPDVIQMYAGSIHSDSTLKYATLTGWEGATAGDRDSGKVDCWQNEVWMQIDFTDDGDSSMVDTINTDTILWTVYLASKPADSIFVFGIVYDGLTFFRQDTTAGLYPDKTIARNTYSVYHSTKRNNLEYKLTDRYTEYANGKAFQVLRPEFVQDNDDRDWMAITIDTVSAGDSAVCSLFVSDSLRDNGSYPVIIETRIEVTYRTVGSGYAGANNNRQLEYIDHIDNTYSGDLYVYAVHAWVGNRGGDAEEAVIGIATMATDVSPPSQNDGHYADSLLITSSVYNDVWGEGQTMITWIVEDPPIFNADTTFYVGVAGWDWVFYNDNDYTNDTILWGSYFAPAYGGENCATDCANITPPPTCGLGDDGDCYHVLDGSTGTWEEKFGMFWVTFQKEGGTIITNTYMKGVTIE